MSTAPCVPRRIPPVTGEGGGTYPGYLGRPREVFCSRGDPGRACRQSPGEDAGSRTPAGDRPAGAGDTGSGWDAGEGRYLFGIAPED